MAAELAAALAAKERLRGGDKIAHEFEDFWRKSAATINCSSFYGPDRGLVSERAPA